MDDAPRESEPLRRPDMDFTLLADPRPAPLDRSSFGHLLHQPSIRSWISAGGHSCGTFRPDSRSTFAIDWLEDPSPEAELVRSGSTPVAWTTTMIEDLYRWVQEMLLTIWSLRDDLLWIWNFIQEALARGEARTQLAPDEPGEHDRADLVRLRLTMDYRSFATAEHTDAAFQVVSPSDSDGDAIWEVRPGSPARLLGHGVYRPARSREPAPLVDAHPVALPEVDAECAETLRRFLESENTSRWLAWAAYDDVLHALFGLPLRALRRSHP